MFEDNDLADADKLTAKMERKVEDIMVQYAGIGEKCKSLEFLSGRLDDDESNAMAKQNMLESADPAKSILDYRNQELSYTAALQMGAKVLQTSLLDYLG
jgi:flagellar hook-associated protein 3 FlgL